jgi:hypothetical protein
MGQYYKPMFITDIEKPKVKRYFYSHEHTSTFKRNDGSEFKSGNGLKLMEHSYIGNNFVGFVEASLIMNPQRVVWAGDYADSEEWVKEDEEGRKPNLHTMAGEQPHLKSGSSHDFKLPKRYKYIVNHDTRQYVNKSKVPKDSNGWQVHPLPLLTCEGNGRGGGDYRREYDKVHNPDGNKYVGLWARNLISIESVKPKGYTEFEPKFYMD